MLVKSLFDRFLAIFRDETGTTAIEFSLLAIPFVFTVISIVELSLFFATSSVVDGALDVVARQIRVGQIQQEETIEAMEDKFIEIVCSHGDVLTDCNKIEFEVLKLDKFSTDIAATVNEEGGLVDPAFEVDAITAGCVSLIRISYLYEFLTPLYGKMWSNYPGNQRLLIATTVVKSEPFDFDVDEDCSI